MAVFLRPISMFCKVLSPTSSTETNGEEHAFLQIMDNSKTSALKTGLWDGELEW